MTFQKSCFNFKLFKETVKQQKYIVLMHTIFLLLCTTLPAVMVHNNIREAFQKYNADELTTWLTGFNALMMMLVTAAAVITSISLFNYLYKPQSVLFYHSMEHTRETIYVSRFLAGIFTLIVPIIPVYIINTVVFAAFGITKYVGISIMLKAFLVVALMYICVFSVSCFAASVSGNFFAQLGMIAFVFLVYIVSTAIIQGSMATILENVSLRVAYGEAYIFPPMKLVELDYGTITVAEVIYIVIYTLAFAVGGLVLYKFRKSESTGKFFAYGKLASFLKYYISFFSALAFGLLFASMSDRSVVISLLGYAVGAFLSFVILQGIFGKNFKAMFENMKGFAILTVCTIILVIVPLLNPDMFYILPNASGIRAIDMDTSGHGYYNTYKLETKENILSAVTAMKQVNNSEHKYYMRAGINPDNKLFSLQYKGYISDEAYNDYMKSIYDTAEYKNIMLKRMELGNDERNEYPWIELTRHTSYSINTKSGINSEKEVHELVDMFKKEYAKYTYDDVKRSRVYAMITINGENHKVYECYTETVNYIKEKYKDNIEYSAENLKELSIKADPENTDIPIARTESAKIESDIDENEVTVTFSAETDMEAIEKILSESVEVNETDLTVILTRNDVESRNMYVNTNNYSQEVREIILQKQRANN